MGMMASPMESPETCDRVSSLSKYCLYLACRTLISTGRLPPRDKRTINTRPEDRSQVGLYLALPAGAEVQLPGRLLPVYVGDVLSLGPAQPPASPPRAPPGPLGLVIGGRRLSGLLEDLLVCRGRGGGVGGLTPSHCRGSRVDAANLTHPMWTMKTCRHFIIIFSFSVLQFLLT